MLRWLQPMVCTLYAKPDTDADSLNLDQAHEYVI